MIDRACLVLAFVFVGGAASPALTGCSPMSVAVAGDGAITGTLDVYSVRKGRTRHLRPGAKLAEDAYLRFEATTTGRGYLYLLEDGGSTVHLVYPISGTAWPAEAGRSKLTPQPSWLREEDPRLPGWQSGEHGPVEYVLVHAPVPRDVPSDQRLPSVDVFLMPPPLVRGPAAEPAIVIARVPIVWPTPESDATGSDTPGEEQPLPSDQVEPAEDPTAEPEVPELPDEPMLGGEEKEER